MGLVIGAHRAQRTHLMIGELVVGIAMLRAKHTSRPRVTSRRAVRLDLHPMSKALRDVPSLRKTHRIDGTSGDATSHRARGTRIESERLTGSIENFIHQNRRTKRDPWAINRMHHDAEDAGSAESGRFSRLHAVERRSITYKWIDYRVIDSRARERGGYV